MNYVWDPRKNRGNLVRHQRAFEDAIGIFDGPTPEKVDDRFDNGEIRIYAIGIVNDLEITMICTEVSETERQLFQHGGQSSMNAKRTGKASSNRQGSTDWKRLRSLTGREIRKAIEKDTEVRPTDANFWKKAKVVLPQPKQTVTMRLDADLLTWLRRQKGYQTRINAVLRTYMDSHKS